MIFAFFAASDSMRLDCTGTSGLGFGPLVFDLYLKAEGSDLCYLGTTFGHLCFAGPKGIGPKGIGNIYPYPI